MPRNYFSDTIKSQLKHDAPYAWFLLHQSKQSPLFNQQSLDTLQERLDAYMECFILSQKAGDSLISTLNMSDWGAVYVAAHVGLVCEDKEALALAIASVQTQQQSIELSDALIEEGYASTKILMEELIQHENPWVRIAAIEVLEQQHITLHDVVMNVLIEDEAPEVQAAIMQLIGEYKLNTYKSMIEKALEHPDENLRYHATHAGCLLQIPQAYRTLQSFCFSPNPHLKNALGILYHVVKEEHILELLHEVSNKIPSSRIKAYNLAMAGLPEAIPLLLKQMENIEDAKYCAEAFSIITGVDLEKEDLTRMEPLSDEEEELLMRTQKEDSWTSFYEDDLPLPDTALLTQWWQKHQNRFEKGVRYLSGKRFTQENLHEIITYGNQVQRYIAKTILALKYPQDVDLSDEIFHVDCSNKIVKRDNIHKAKQYAPRTGAYQAFLPQGHKDEARLLVNPFAYNTYNAGDKFTYEGLEEFDISLIEWRMREEGLK